MGETVLDRLLKYKENAFDHDKHVLTLTSDSASSKVEYGNELDGAELHHLIDTLEHWHKVEQGLPVGDSSKNYDAAPEPRTTLIKEDNFIQARNSNGNYIILMPHDGYIVPVNDRRNRICPNIATQENLDILNSRYGIVVEMNAVSVIQLILHEANK